MFVFLMVLRPASGSSMCLLQGSTNCYLNCYSNLAGITASVLLGPELYGSPAGVYGGLLMRHAQNGQTTKQASILPGVDHGGDW